MRILRAQRGLSALPGLFYRRQAGLASAAYATQMAARNASLFGVADFLFQKFAALGTRRGNPHQQSLLQAAWAREHGIATDVSGAARRGGRRQNASSVAAASRDAVQTDPGPLARKIGLSPGSTAQPRTSCLARSSSSNPIWCSTRHLSYRHRFDPAHRGIGKPVMIGQSACCRRAARTGASTIS